MVRFVTPRIKRTLSHHLICHRSHMLPMTCSCTRHTMFLVLAQVVVVLHSDLTKPSSLVFRGPVPLMATKCLSSVAEKTSLSSAFKFGASLHNSGASDNLYLLWSALVRMVWEQLSLCQNDVCQTGKHERRWWNYTSANTIL